MTARQRESVSNKSTNKEEVKNDKPKENKNPFKGRFNPKIQKRPERSADGTWLDHQAYTKLIMGAAIGIVVYFTIHQNKTADAPLAKRNEFLNGKRSQQSLCAPSFKKEIEELGNKMCLPARCGRVVNDGLVTPEESHALLKLAKKGLAKGGSNGGASIIDLHSGALSSDDHFINLYKQYPGLFEPRDFTVYRTVKDRIKNYLADHFEIDPTSLYLTHPTFFSRLDNKPAKTMHDEYWHLHIDKETYPSFHYTSLLYLTDHGDDFQGGEFVFVDTHDKLNRTIEPRLGRLSFFTSGIENKHFVKPITSGVRYALTMGFTCDVTKAIADPGSAEHAEIVNE